MKDSATLTGWRRSQQSGEGKMIPLLGPGIYTPNYRAFPVFTEFSGDLLCAKKERVTQCRIELTLFRLLILSYTPRPQLPGTIAYKI